MNTFAQTLNQNLKPIYVDKFQLTIHPFSNLFSHEIFFENESRKEILKKISHLLEFTKLVLFIQGAPGLGKTSLLKHRINAPKKNWRVCYINANQVKDYDDFIEKIFQDFKLPIQENQSDSLQQLISDIKLNGDLAILVIDDIEELNKSIIPTLSSLINHTVESEPLIRLVASGQDLPLALTEIIPKEEDAHALKYLPLPPLTEKETREYIGYRLHKAGYKFTEPFNKQKVNKIYLDSKGFPDQINVLADHLFTQYAQNYEKQKPILNLNQSTNKTLILTAIGLSILILIILIYSMATKEEKLEDIPLKNDMQDLIIPPKIIKPSPTIKQETTQKKPTNTPPAQEASTDSSKSDKTNMATPIKKETVAINATNKNITTKTDKQSAEKKPALTNPSLDNYRKWIMAQNPKHYTMQLISGSKLSSAESFIQRHNIKKDASVFMSKRKGKIWFAVIYKSFNSKSNANQAKEALPSALKKLKPWIRQFSGIQKSISETN